MSTSDRFQMLCQAQIEGYATEAEGHELAELLQQDESAMRQYVEQMRIQGMLVCGHGEARPSVFGASPEKRVSPARWSLLAATCAALLMIGLVAWWGAQEPQPGVTYEVLRSDTNEFTVGHVRTSESLNLDKGQISFRTSSGAVVDVTGPAKLDLINPMHLRVVRGGVSVDIGEGKKGFVIETPDARVVDLGTRFAVSAGGPKGTEVAVFEGKVEVYDSPVETPASKPQVTLIEGEAIRIDAERQTQRLGLVRLNSDASALRDDADPDIVSNVQDNQEDERANRYYGFVRGGMRDGAKAYTTRSKRVWRPAPGEDFPADLVGADQICTIPSYRTKPVFKLTMTISQPCDLYVMADAGPPYPEWLQASFVNTGLRLRSGPWVKDMGDQPGVPYDVVHTVWRRRILEPGTVELGAPQAEGSKIKPAMYGIAVKAVP